nr:hypothetical protein [Kibdelosporangium sp. MJ126-NF4]
MFAPVAIDAAYLMIQKTAKYIAALDDKGKSNPDTSAVYEEALGQMIRTMPGAPADLA